MTAVHWKPFDESAGLWMLGQTLDGVCILRSVALRLADGTLAVVGPIRESPRESFTELDALGRPVFLLAPNFFHHLGLAAYAEKFPDAQVVASAKATPRLSRQITCPIGPLADLQNLLPDRVSLLEPSGTRNGEVWLRAETAQGVVWIVSDAFFNLPRTPRTVMGIVVRLFGIGPGLRIGPTFKWIALKNRREYAVWLKGQLEADQPSVLIPGHGDICEGDDLPDRLTALAAKRLPHF